MPEFCFVLEDPLNINNIALKALCGIDYIYVVDTKSEFTIQKLYNY